MSQDFVAVVDAGREALGVAVDDRALDRDVKAGALPTLLANDSADESSLGRRHKEAPPKSCS